MDDLPRNHDPTRRHGRDDDPTSDIEVFGAEVAHIVGARDDVRGQVRPDLRHDPAETDEEGARAPGRPIPFRSQRKRVPDVLAVDDHGAAGADDAEDAQHKLDQGQECDLPVDRLLVSEIAREIGDVG